MHATDTELLYLQLGKPSFLKKTQAAGCLMSCCRLRACKRASIPTFKVVALGLQVVLALLLFQLGSQVTCCKLVSGVLPRLPAAGEEQGKWRCLALGAEAAAAAFRIAGVLGRCVAPELKLGVPWQILHRLLLAGRVNAHTALLLMALQAAGRDRNICNGSARSTVGSKRPIVADSSTGAPSCAPLAFAGAQVGLWAVVIAARGLPDQENA